MQLLVPVQVVRVLGIAEVRCCFVHGMQRQSPCKIYAADWTGWRQRESLATLLLKSDVTMVTTLIYYTVLIILEYWSVHEPIMNHRLAILHVSPPLKLVDVMVQSWSWASLKSTHPNTARTEPWSRVHEQLDGKLERRSIKQ